MQSAIVPVPVSTRRCKPGHSGLNSRFSVPWTPERNCRARRLAVAFTRLESHIDAMACESFRNPRRETERHFYTALEFDLQRRLRH